jgi:hypothetical protein
MPATKRPVEASLVRLDDGRLVLQLREGVRRLRQTYYHLEPLPSDFGRAFRVQKFASCGGDGTAYAVCLQDGADLCDCKGRLAHGHCRHISSLRSLVERGEL